MSIKALMIAHNEPEHIRNLKFGGASKVVTPLDHGDIWLTTDSGDLLCIERKTPTDLLGSIKDGRVFVQVAGMREKTPWSYLVITGLLGVDNTGKVIADNRSTGWDWNSVQGALLTIQELGVAVVHSSSESDYEACVMRLAARKRGDEYILTPKHDTRYLSPGEAILTSLPGIGWERAKTILEYFNGDCADALAWLTWEGSVTEVSGVGKATKVNIRKAMNAKPGKELYYWGKEDFAYYEKTIKGEPLPIEPNQVTERNGVLEWKA